MPQKVKPEESVKICLSRGTPLKWSAPSARVEKNRAKMGTGRLGSFNARLSGAQSWLVAVRLGELGLGESGTPPVSTAVSGSGSGSTVAGHRIPEIQRPQRRVRAS